MSTARFTGRGGTKHHEIRTLSSCDMNDDVAGRAPDNVVVNVGWWFDDEGAQKLFELFAELVTPACRAVVTGRGLEVGGRVQQVELCVAMRSESRSKDHRCV
jgi:hypothetical protein